MKTPTLYAHSVALLLVAALASCSHKQKSAEPPPAPKPTAAEESQKSFQLAAQEQRELTEQAKRVEAAHNAVVAAQQQLARAQSQEQQERAKAQQLQQRASQHLQEGVRQAQQAQAGLAGMGSLEGMQTVAGQVAQATPSHVVLQTPGGRTMTFSVDPRTRVLLGTEQRSVADIQQGADAQVAYDPRAGQMTALIIRVMPVESPPATSPPERPETQPRR
jgi:hypothetical protein